MDEPTVTPTNKKILDAELLVWDNSRFNGASLFQWKNIECRKTDMKREKEVRHGERKEKDRFFLVGEQSEREGGEGRK